MAHERKPAYVTPGGRYLAFDQDDADPSHPVDLSTFGPADPARFALQVDIGTDEDTFSVFVYSPLWPAEHFSPGPPSRWPEAGPTPKPAGFPPMWSESGAAMFGRGMMFLREWTFADFETAVLEAFAEARGSTSAAAALEVDRVFPWEFTDSPDRRP